jgi:hypothetical protein
LFEAFQLIFANNMLQVSIDVGQAPRPLLLSHQSLSSLSAASIQLFGRESSVPFLVFSIQTANAMLIPESKQQGPKIELVYAELMIQRRAALKHGAELGWVVSFASIRVAGRIMRF